MRNYLYSILFFSGCVLGQENSHLQLKKKDTICLTDCFRKAHWEAHTRSFFMSTLNEGNLKDDYAMATGAGIGVITKPVYGFQAGMSGFFAFKLFSSEIYKSDSLTKSANRYEIGLFDVENPHNESDMDRLEELYLRYANKKLSIAGGRMNLNTPFFNPQDGRMRPTLEEGIWINVNEWKKFSFAGGWISRVSPRSTVRWVSLSESMGVFSSGVNNDGTKSEYHDNVQGCTGMAIANVNYRFSERIKVILWNGFLENVMNTSVAEIRGVKNAGSNSYYSNLLFIHQDAINKGGNSNPHKSYFSGRQSNAVSAQVGVKQKRNNFSLNYTHITGDGRYLLPREWGRENLYTYLPRERLEGSGMVHAAMVKWDRSNRKERLHTVFAYGYYALPRVDNFRLNKYGLPSYHHLYAEADYSFGRFFQGMLLRIIITSKIEANDRPNDLKYIYNKVNMINFNVILDYKI